MINEPIKYWKEWISKCVICSKEIDFNKEKYIKLTDFEGKKEVSYCFYHLECWLNRFQVTQEKITQQANQWLDKLTKSISQLTGGEKSYEVFK